MMHPVELPEDAIRAQVQRIVGSDLFRASEIQRRLFVYLAKKSLDGEADQLKEYTVGIEGIGKSESYDPRRDSTVRLQTSKLRQKITEYYLDAGRTDPIQIDFPKGHFKLVFSPRQSTEKPASAESHWWRYGAIASFAAFIMASSLCVVLGNSLWRPKNTVATAGKLPPSGEAFWSPFIQTTIETNKPVLISAGTSLFVRLGHRGYFRDPNANTWDQAVHSDATKRMQQAFPEVTPDPWYAFTTLGELNSAFILGKVLSPRIPGLQLASSTDLSWNQIGSNSIIFVGPPKFNLQVMDLPVQQDLVLEPPAGVRNLRPNPGEPGIFVDEETAQTRSGFAYSLISCLPGINLPGINKDGHIVVLAGSGIPGTLAATQYVTSEVYAADLLRHIRLPSGEIPSYYQVSIRSRYYKWVPVEIRYVLHHVLTIEPRKS
jgi:hypothetical protein